MSLTEELKLLITGSSASATKALAEAGAESEALGVKTKLSDQLMQKLGVSGVNTGTLLKGALVGGAIAGGAAIAKFALDGVEQFANLTGQVRAFQRVSGTTAGDASKLTFAVKELGIAPDAASSAFGRFATRLGTGKVDLAQFGVEIAKNKDGTTDLAGTVANLSDAYQKTSDPTIRAALANEAFGRSWQTLAPLLAKGKVDLQQIYDQAGKDHQIFSQDDLEKGRQFTLATKQLSDAFKGLEVEVGAKAIPQVTQFATALTKTIQFADSAGKAAGGFGAKVAQAGLDSIPGIGTLHQLGGEINDLTGWFDSGSDSSNKYTDAQTKLSDAQKKAADLAANNQTNTKAYKDAVKDAADATGVLTDAQQKLLKSLTDSTTATYNLQQAELKSGSDKVGLENTVASLSTAMDNYNVQLYANETAGDHSKAAQDALAASHRDLVSATLASVAAAAKKAADDLGPNATAADKMKASTAAQQYQLLLLEQQFPGLRGQVQGYVGDLDKVPPAKNTTVTIDASQAHAVLDILEGRLTGLTASTHNIVIGVTGVGAKLYNGP